MSLTCRPASPRSLTAKPLRSLLCVSALLAIGSSAAAQVTPRGVVSGGVVATKSITLLCPLPVTVQAPMPAAGGGWSGNHASWNLQLDANPTIALQIVPQPSANGDTVICHYVAKNFDGVLIKGLAYSQTVGNATCVANVAKTGFTCTKK